MNTHKFGQWMRVEGEMGRGILIMSSWNRASWYCAESSRSSWWKILSIDNIHKPQQWIPRTISACVCLLVCSKTRVVSVWVLVSVNERNAIALSRRTALRVLISLVCLVRETETQWTRGHDTASQQWAAGYRASVPPFFIVVCSPSFPTFRIPPVDNASKKKKWCETCHLVSCVCLSAVFFGW